MRTVLDKNQDRLFKNQDRLFKRREYRLGIKTDYFEQKCGENAKKTGQIIRKSRQKEWYLNRKTVNE